MAAQIAAAVGAAFLVPMNSELLHKTLSRLMPHLDADRIALTGRVAIGVHLDVTCGDRTRAVAAEDVDFVAAHVDAVRETATREFLVSHFHVPRPGYAKRGSTTIC